MAKLVVEESPLSSFLGDLPSILFQYNERRLSEQRQDMKLQEAREYEKQKLIELREYQDKVRDQQNQNSLLNLLAQDARTNAMTGLRDYTDVQDMYMKTLGKLPDRSDAVNKVLDASYGTTANNINDYIALQDNKYNVLTEASRTIEGNLNALKKEANQYIAENTVDFYNLNFPDEVLDKKEFELLSNQFIKGVRIKGLDDQAAENLMKATYYQTPYEDRVKLMQENVKDKVEKKLASAGNYMTMLAGAFGEKSDDKQSIIRALGGNNAKQLYEVILSAMGNTPKDAYDMLETYKFNDTQYGTEVLRDLASNRSIKAATRANINQFLNTMEDIELLSNPIGGGTLSQMERLVEGMETTDLREPINTLLGIVGSYDEIVQADHFDALGRIMIDKGLVTQDGYDELLQQVLTDDNTNKVMDEIDETSVELLSALKEEMQGGEIQMQSFNDALDLIEEINDLKKSGDPESLEKSLELLEEFNSKRITDDNEDQLDIEDFTSTSSVGSRFPRY